MDFWSRLLAHTPLSSGSSRADIAKDPVKRLYKFEKEYSQLLQQWRKTSNLAADEEAAENIEIQLQELTNMLADESQRPLPHPCISFASAKQVYVPVAKIANTSYNEWIIREAVMFFATLIESEEEAFVESQSFASSLTNLLVRVTGANSIRLAQDTETRVVELAFNITTKIRLEPEILPAWFKSHQDARREEKQRDEREKFAGRTQKQDFPLFYLLIDYIHHDGKVGDFARTGLLYVIEAASHSVDLEQWIVESDLSTLMATGLGALYSQLSRKLVIDHPAQGLPPVLAFSDYQHPSPTLDIVSSCSPEFQAHLDTFLSHLLFWQDVLNHCRSVEVKSTLLEHFQIIFLQQLLYPSLLESSDIDGGSSVAVLTYLRRILESLDHPDMINLILHYLLTLPDATPSAAAAPTRTAVSAARKRKSMDLKSMMAAQSTSDVTPLLFNLVDLIRACLRSQSSQTIYVTLQLVSAILKRHHRYAVITLLHTESVPGHATHRTIGGHEQEVEFLMHLAGIIGGQDNFDEVYENVLRDTVMRVETHPCSLKLVVPKTSTQNHKLPAVPDSLPGAPRDLQPHTLRPDDILLNILLDRLETFFVNPVESNLALTEVIYDLALCGYVHVEGWLLRTPEAYTFEDEDEMPTSPAGMATNATVQAPPDPDSPSYEEFVKAEAIRKCRRRPLWQSSSLPRLLNILQKLADQVAAYREVIPRFDDLVQQRREAFQIADSADNPPPPSVRTKNPPAQTATERTSLDEPRTGSPARPSAIEGFAQRIFSDLGSTLGTPSSRSASPRGRKEVARSPAPMLQTPSKPLPALPKEFPMPPYANETPSRSGLGSVLAARSYSPGSSDGGSRLGDPVASQVAAFQAIDHAILARRVGIPGSKGDVKPVKLVFEAHEPVKEPGAEAAGSTSEAIAVKDVEDESVETEEEDEAPETPAEVTATVSHVITNVIMLQSFLFELASLLQVRAGLFDEVRFV